MELVGSFTDPAYSIITIRHGIVFAFHNDKLECDAYPISHGMTKKTTHALNIIDGPPSFDINAIDHWHILTAMQDGVNVAYTFYVIDADIVVKIYCGKLSNCKLVGYDDSGIVMHREDAPEPLLVWKPMPSKGMSGVVQDPTAESSVKLYQIPACDLLVRSSAAPDVPKYNIGYDRGIIRCICVEGYRGVVCLNTRTMALQPGQFTVCFPADFIISEKAVVWTDGKRLYDLYGFRDLTPQLTAVMSPKGGCEGIISIGICHSGPLIEVLCESGHHHILSVNAMQSQLK